MCACPKHRWHSGHDVPRGMLMTRCRVDMQAVNPAGLAAADLAWHGHCGLPCHDWALASTGLRTVQVPIMLRSSYCSLDSMSEKEITDVGECPYDQVLAMCMPACQPLACS